MAAQSVLSVIAYRAKLGCAWFPRYIYFATAQSFILLAIAYTNLPVYIAVYLLGSIIGTVLALAVVGSLWRLTFGSPASLPPGTLTRFRTLVLSIVCPLAAVLIGFFRAHSSHAYFNSLINLETVVLSATGVTLALMVVYSKHLGISWRSKPAGILGGFLWCFGINWLAMFLAGRETMSIYAAQRIGQVAYLIALVLWGRVLLEKERASEKTTNEKLDRVLQEFELMEIFGARLRTRPTQT
ncbi:MAG TPA: hypothetical protein VGP89_17830 [Candidatus Angelobacter sp.]|jgi:hypothetical protein|nr:hypothetical protein [Candidatus Angelobacter sp.]